MTTDLTPKELAEWLKDAFNIRMLAAGSERFYGDGEQQAKRVVQLIYALHDLQVEINQRRYVMESANNMSESLFKTLRELEDARAETEREHNVVLETRRVARRVIKELKQLREIIENAQDADYDDDDEDDEDGEELPAGQVPIIVETDFGTDADDVFDIASTLQYTETPIE